jgi:hypothetical protein
MRHPLCQDANDVYYDGAPLGRVTSAAALGAGACYFDSTRQQVWIGSNPVGHSVEAAVLPYAWHGWGSGADNVVIGGLTIEHAGGIAVQGRANWTVVSSEIRWNHVTAIEDALTVRDNYLHDNGQAGYETACQCTSSTTTAYFTGNEVAFNNHGSYAGYDTSYDASGMKFMQIPGIVVSNNDVHDNGGPGLWSDTNVTSAVYDSNRRLRAC